MAFYNLARMYSETTGTDDLVLTTAVPGCNTFDDAGVSDGATLEYALTTYSLSTHRATGRECGSGTWDLATLTLTRDTVEDSTNSGSKITLTGLSEVYLAPLASDFAGFGGGGGVSSAKYSGGVTTVSVSSTTSDTLVINAEEWDDASLASVASNTVTFGVTGTYEICIEVFWDIPTAGAPNGVLGVIVATTQGNHEKWEHFETADDMASNSIFMSWKAAYTSGDTIGITAQNFMGRTMRFLVREVSLMKIG